jgi:hypothetical protein
MQKENGTLIIEIRIILHELRLSNVEDIVPMGLVGIKIGESSEKQLLAMTC